MTAKEVKGVGIWANPELFEKSAGLPVVKAIRGITTNLIKTRLENDPQIVFSIGIGPGIMYKDFIEKFTDHSLRLLGIDVLPDMLRGFSERSSGFEYSRCEGKFWTSIFIR